ncbi:MAG: 50S ribosomal protein L29 [Phascolarctobacterium sp.]|mgnify:FL=1|jgi:large subunit ribosomal protein L29|nr:50S ribosomal protein L29 [Phascolarctobacterium sp.]MDY2636749.1 50S ribosomal protein L29 [Phascolarctobacterium sp.]MDY5105520.1 50S ribosomal protein L29 [Megasphaera elsdenii]MEE1194160.1 50S ribosomal protein L29 [Phascolarctobacterium sp.]MEE1229770.1 50S ribosomal protein L29 [Phascolarctobacterium sp.]
MKTTEIRELSAAELDTKLADLKEQLFNLRFQMATGQCENPMKIRDVKKSIARIKTIQRERELKA